MKALLCSLALLLWTHAAAAASLKPLGVEQFFLNPDEPAALRWQIDSGELAGPLDYTIRDSAGKAVRSGTAKIEGKSVEAPVRVGSGFFEIELPAAGQTFGLVALPAWRGPKDAFFAIDSALSWLVRDDAMREGMIKALARSGVGMSRERLAWSQIQPASGAWHWEADRGYERVRKTCAAAGVEVLEMFHDAPAWLGHVGKYPDDLSQTARAWEQIARRWQGTWGGLEVWNEPDIFFGDNLPADQYAPLAEAVAWACMQAGVKTPLVGGVVAHHHRRYLDTAARCGLLERVDAYSFHTYGRAMEMESLLDKYRSWLRAYSRESMPLWLTECGRPWNRGPERPPADQDATSALDITMKGVEARACGVARYFPFVYPYYDENQNNFGMMDRRGTPLRSIAAYAQLVRALAGKEYLGDLKCDDRTVLRARVFGGAREAVLVLYTGRPRATASVKLPLPAARVEGIDGRPLAAADSGQTPIPDGLCYVWLDRAKAAGRLQSDTLAMRLWRASRQPPPRRGTPSPVVLRVKLDKAVLEPRTEGYRVVDPARQSRLPLSMEAFNLGPQAQEVTVRLSLEAGAKPGASLEPKRLRIAPGAKAQLDWQLDLAPVLGSAGRAAVIVSAEGRDAGRIAPRLVEIAGEVSLAQLLRQHPGAVALPLGDLKRWTPKVAGIGRMSMDSTPQAAWRLTASFRPGDRWVYPEFRLPERVVLDKAVGLAIRARCQKPAAVRMIAWEGETGVGYLTVDSLIPADAEWHTAVVRFADLAPSTANAPDANGKLDLDQVHRLSLGMNSEAAENTLEVSDAYVLAGR